MLTAIRHWRIMGRVELIETSSFTRLTALLSDEEYATLQSRLVAHPDLGAVFRRRRRNPQDPRCSWREGQESGSPSHLLLGHPKRPHPVALRVPEERVR